MFQLMHYSFVRDLMNKVGVNFDSTTRTLGEWVIEYY